MPDRVNAISLIQGLQAVPEIPIDVGQIVMGVTCNGWFIIKVTRREYLAVILEWKVCETLVIQFPLAVISSWILPLPVVLRLRCCQVRNPLHEREQKLTNRLDIVLVLLSPPAKVPNIFRKSFYCEGH